RVYWESDLNVNLCPTGGIDKAVLEGMAAGIPTVVANEAYRPIYGEYWHSFFAELRSPESTADKIELYYHSERKVETAKQFQLYIKDHYELGPLIGRILAIL
ncbi:hypothetical protein L0Y46_04825, partial [bacterium]|nr:hypothetical protein [bacterium]